MAFCVNCGEKLVAGAKFCHSCGTPVGGISSVNNNIRKEEYAGKIFKCPNCGAVITESTVICPECGTQITGREAVSSVKKFEEKLMEIESKRKGGIIDALTKSSNVVDNQKLNLIKSFPIPNTVTDINEFIFLAIANIDVKLSKQSVGSKFSSALNSNDKNLKMQKNISDAWVLKMQQAYQKALVSFQNDPTFEGMQKVYLDKLKELKIK